MDAVKCKTGDKKEYMEGWLLKKRQKRHREKERMEKKRAKLEGEKANIKRVDDVVSGCCFGMRTGPRRLTGSSKSDFASAGGVASN